MKTWVVALVAVLVGASLPGARSAEVGAEAAVGVVGVAEWNLGDAASTDWPE